MFEFQDKSYPEQFKETMSDAVGDLLSNTTIALGAVVLSAALIAGCSPQQKGWWGGDFTKLPAPPAESRLQIGVSTEADGTVFINYLTWDKDKSQFVRKDYYYTTEAVIGHTSQFQEAGGYVQQVNDREVLVSGIIVDQKKGLLILPNGLNVDGRTGNIVNSDGKVVENLQTASTKCVVPTVPDTQTNSNKPVETKTK